jgi:hypothetical protein
MEKMKRKEKWKKVPRKKNEKKKIYIYIYIYFMYSFIFGCNFLKIYNLIYTWLDFISPPNTCVRLRWYLMVRD